MGFPILDVVQDDFGVEPVEGQWASYGVYRLVGNGVKTNEHCSVFLTFYGCNRVELHDIIASDGKNYKGKVYVKRVHHYCNNPNCPVCFKHGWAVREAGRIEARLLEASKRFGLIEHIICSVPVRDYGLSYEALRAKAVKALVARGVVGGCLIFHGFRYNPHRHWYWSVHFHVLGFVLGGYPCRDCHKECLDCVGFEARTRREYAKDGFIVKIAEDKLGVKGKRVTVFGSAWYQLNHSSVKKDVVRFHVATWFGCCSYRKLKVSVKVRKAFCRICESDLEKLRYVGNRFVADANLFGSEREFYADAVDASGCVVWAVDTRRKA